MATQLTDYYKDLIQEVVSSADAEGIYHAESFFNFCGSILAESGEIETADYSPYIDSRGFTLVDGYGGDPNESDGILSLIVGDFSPSETIGSLTNTEITRLFRRLQNFVQQSLKSSFREALSPLNPGFGLADTISTCWGSLEGVKLIIITNRLLSSIESNRPVEEVEGVRCTFSIWDVRRLGNIL